MTAKSVSPPLEEMSGLSRRLSIQFNPGTRKTAGRQTRVQLCTNIPSANKIYLWRKCLVQTVGDSSSYVLTLDVNFKSFLNPTHAQWKQAWYPEVVQTEW